MPVFNNINGVSAYIKSACFNEIVNEIGDKSIETMKDVTKDQVEGQTGDIINCIGVTEKTNDTVTVAWEDKGGWFSLSEKTKGTHMYAPWANEHGKVWDIKGGSRPGSPVYKPATTLEDTSKKEISKDSIEITKKILRNKGFK